MPIVRCWWSWVVGVGECCRGWLWFLALFVAVLLLAVVAFLVLVRHDFVFRVSCLAAPKVFLTARGGVVL